MRRSLQQKVSSPEVDQGQGPRLSLHHGPILAAWDSIFANSTEISSTEFALQILRAKVYAKWRHPVGVYDYDSKSCSLINPSPSCQWRSRLLPSCPPPPPPRARPVGVKYTCQTWEFCEPVWAIIISSPHHFLSSIHHQTLCCLSSKYLISTQESVDDAFRRKNRVLFWSFVDAEAPISY